MQFAISPLSIETEVCRIPLVDDHTPVRIGSGTICSVLGESAAAVVFEIKAAPRNRAVKLLRPERTARDIQRLRASARAQAGLMPHSGLAGFHHHGMWQGLDYMETELIRGRSIDKYASRGALPVAVCTAIGVITARCLSFFHHPETPGRQGCAHGNIKPANILLTRAGEVKLTDLGAVLTGPAWQNPGRTLVDSLRYAAPEQLMGEVPQAHSDLFSLAVILSELLTGQEFYPAEYGTRLIKNRLEHTTDLLKACRSTSPRRLVQLLRQCLSREPLSRPADARQVADELREVHARISDEYPRKVLRQFCSGVHIQDPPKGGSARVIRTAAAAAVLSAGIYGLIRVTGITDPVPDSHPAVQSDTGADSITSGTMPVPAVSDSTPPDSAVLPYDSTARH